MKHNTSEQQLSFVRKYKNNQPTANLELPPYVPMLEPIKVQKPVSALDLKQAEMLLYVLEMRYLDARCLVNKFFTEKSLEAEQEINKLIEAKVLKARELKKLGETIYLVTEEGRNELLKVYPKKKLAEITKQVFEPRVKHDLLLADLRIRFEELGFLNKWYSEAMLNEVPLFLREFQDLPDAVCRKKNEKAYFLELEVSKKSPKVYRERTEEYLKVLKKQEIQDAQIEGVIFFCKAEEVQKVIKKQVPENVKSISVLLYDNYFARAQEMKKA